MLPQIISSLAILSFFLPIDRSIDSEIDDDALYVESRQSFNAAISDAHGRSTNNGSHEYRSADSAPDPCSDPNSAEFSQGYCGGLLMCRGDGVVGELVLIEHERRHYADNADIYAQQVATMNYCAEQSESADDQGPSLADLIAREWDELQLPAPVIDTLPKNNSTLVQLETFVQGPQAPITYDTTLLDTPVTLRATPAIWNWDFGDASELLSVNEPGQATIAGEVSHVYRQPGAFQISLTIDWYAEFTIDNGATWQTVPGTGHTTASIPMEAKEKQTRLHAKPKF